ncbi:MAG: class I SAM-dependent methyltransferase [Candidatus Woesearchaeota archaeon]
MKKTVLKKTQKDVSIQLQEHINENAYNYNIELYKLIKPYIGRSILDVGCSIGNITKFFLSKNNNVVGIDVVSESVGIIKKKFSKNKKFKAYHMNAEDNKILSLKNNKFDTIVCINVLEHIKGDLKTLKNFHNLLESKGKLVLFVPAIPALYGSVDKADHHFRRYTKKILRKKLMDSKFRITRMKYINFLGIFGWYLNGKILKKNKVDANMLGFYNKIVPLLFKMEKHIPLPIGLSIFCVCEKIE